MLCLPLDIDVEKLSNWGTLWRGETNPETSRPKRVNSFDKQQSVNFGKDIFDFALARSLSIMLGNIPIVPPANSNSLLPPSTNCIELGNTRVIGGVRPQNFDLVYRPDGVRIAYDSKTLNDLDSVRKNWQNMVNDLATEATTVHTRFPYAVVAFPIAIPKPALAPIQAYDIIRTLERLGKRKNVLNQFHLAELISLTIWDPETGNIDDSIPPNDSLLRVENLGLFHLW